MFEFVILLNIEALCSHFWITCDTAQVANAPSILNCSAWRILSRHSNYCCQGIMACFVMICLQYLTRIGLCITILDNFAPMLTEEVSKSEEHVVFLEQWLLKQTRTCSSYWAITKDFFHDFQVDVSFCEPQTDKYSAMPKCHLLSIDPVCCVGLLSSKGRWSICYVHDFKDDTSEDSCCVNPKFLEHLFYLTRTSTTANRKPL